VSEQGWRDFLDAEGVEDWVVLHGGAAAAFRVATAQAGGQLVQAIAGIDGFADVGAILSLSGNLVTVRLTRGVYRIEELHVALARAVSSVASAHGAVADRAAVQEVQVAISAKPDLIDVDFWRAVLGYSPLAPDNGVDPLGHGSTFWMQELDPNKPLRHAMHIDVSLAREEAEHRVAAALESGGRIVEETNAPGSWVLADRAGNKVCVVAWPDGADTPGWTNQVDEPPA
jgi:4a-hydroxytetrahydrobiopterin dehydratase